MKKRGGATTGAETVNIRPGVSILSVLQHLNYKPWFALAEFVDNALHSYLRHKKDLRKADGRTYGLRVEIDINLRGVSEIIVRDNAGGIYPQEFPRAFRPAELPDDRTGLAEFGMGMKSAACWFARRWSVRTSALGDPHERTVEFNIADIVKAKREQLHVKTRTAPRNSHFTEITLHDLHHLPKGGRTIGKIKEHLTGIYRVFIREGALVLKIDGEELKYEEPNILNAPHYKRKGKSIKWRKPIMFKVGKQKVHGFAGLRDPASTLYAGFALFRRHRLIEGSGDETYRPAEVFGNSNSYRYQRLFGELHLEGFDVSHTKDGFRWEEHEAEFLERLKRELQKSPLNLLDQAEGYRAKPSKKSVQDKAKIATDRVAETMQHNVQPVLTEEAENPARPRPVPESLKKSKLEASERTVEIDDGRQVWVVTVRTTLDPGIGQWLRLSNKTSSRRDVKGRRTLTIDVSLAHPFVVQFLGPSNENVELFLRFAIAFALAMVLAADSTSADPSFALHHLNSLLRSAFADGN